MDIEPIKINFSRPMLVLKIRDVYKAPYHKNKYVIIKKTECEYLVDFRKKLHQYTGNWSNGLYDLQFVTKEGTYLQPTIYATLVRIEVRDGKIAKVWKASPYSKKIYPIWQEIKKKPKKIIKKKKPAKKKPKKKVVKKKPPRNKIETKKTPKNKPNKKKKSISKKKITKKFHKKKKNNKKKSKKK